MPWNVADSQLRCIGRSQPARHADTGQCIEHGANGRDAFPFEVTGDVLRDRGQPKPSEYGYVGTREVSVRLTLTCPHFTTFPV